MLRWGFFWDLNSKNGEDNKTEGNSIWWNFLGWRRICVSAAPHKSPQQHESNRTSERGLADTEVLNSYLPLILTISQAPHVLRPPQWDSTGLEHLQDKQRRYQQIKCLSTVVSKLLYFLTGDNEQLNNPVISDGNSLCYLFEVNFTYIYPLLYLKSNPWRALPTR